MKKTFLIVLLLSVFSICTAEPNSSDYYKLWDSSSVFPPVKQIPFPDIITYVRLNRAAKGISQFLHGASITCYNNKFYSSWANSPENENSQYESLCGKTSADGTNWSDIFTIAPDLAGQQRRSHGSFFVFDGRLYIFNSRFTGTDKPLADKQIFFNGLQTEAYVFNEAENKWDYIKIIADDFWPLDSPKKTANGNWILGGIDKNFKSAVALINSKDIYDWQIVKIPQPANQFSETTILVLSDRLLAVMRNSKSDFAAVSESSDSGRTWSVASLSNYPMAASKPFADTLSDGRHYLISNRDKSRNYLTIAISNNTDGHFSKVFMVRSGISRQPVFKGWAKASQWSYPYAVENQGKLYIVYSVGKEDCELAIIPVSSLH